MALNQTTLSAAIGATDISFAVASATGASAPNFTTGVGISYLFCEQEIMLVLSVSGTQIGVQRGYNGTLATAHASGQACTFGLPTDFSGQPPAIAGLQPKYGALPVSLRAAAIQSVSFISVSTNATIGSTIAAFNAEVAATLIQMGVWKGAA